MATVTADTFVIIDKSPLFNEADRLHWTAFNACAAGDASMPNHPRSDGKRIFEQRFKKPLIPRHPIQSKIAEKKVIARGVRVKRTPILSHVR